MFIWYIKRQIAAYDMTPVGVPTSPSGTLAKTKYGGIAKDPNHGWDGATWWNDNTRNNMLYLPDMTVFYSLDYSSDSQGIFYIYKENGKPEYHKIPALRAGIVKHNSTHLF